MQFLETIGKYVPEISVLTLFFLFFLRGMFVVVRNGGKVSACISMWIRRDRRRNKNGKPPEGNPERRGKTEVGMLPFYLSVRYYSLIYCIFIVIIVATAGFLRDPFSDVSGAVKMS